MLLTKLRTLEETRDTLMALNTLSTDVVVDPKEITDITLGSITVPSLGGLRMTSGASTQVAEKAGIPTSTFSWLRQHQPAEAQAILEKQWAGYLESLKPGQKLLIRAREQEGVLYGRAVLTNRYGIIDSLAVVEAMIAALPEHLAKMRVGGMKPKVWLDPLTGAFSFKGILGKVAYAESDPHAWGLCGGNDECGRGSVNFDALYSRVFCTNQFAGLGLGRNRQSHVLGKGGIEKFQEKVSGWLGERIASAEESMQKYWALREDTRDPEDLAKLLVKFGAEAGLPKGELEKVSKEILPTYLAEVGSTSYAVVNSLTHFAKDMEDRARQQLWEAASGKVVNLIR